jgi:hypothetical protein
MKLNLIYCFNTTEFRGRKEGGEHWYPRGGGVCRAAAPPPKANLKIIDFVDTMISRFYVI